MTFTEESKPIWECLYTKEHVASLFSAYGLNHQELPTKKTKVYISHPNGSCTIITKTDKKSTYGKTLYLVQLY